MDRTPYAPPRSEVRDVLPPLAKHQIRTRWFYLALAVFLLSAAAYAWEYLFPAFTLASLGYSLALGGLIAIFPLRSIISRRSHSAPWWWDVVLYSVAGTVIVGAAFDDPMLMGVGLFSAFLWVTAITLSTWVVEAHYHVRAYSKARSIVFVKEEDAL